MSAPASAIVSTARRAASASSTWLSSGSSAVVVMTPPLKPASGITSPSGSTSIARPRGGRLLITAKPIPASPSRRTAAMAAGVRVLTRSTSVPSTSETTSEIFLGAMALPSLPSLSELVPLLRDGVDQFVEAVGEQAHAVLDQRRGHAVQVQAKPFGLVDHPLRPLDILLQAGAR